MWLNCYSDMYHSCRDSDVVNDRIINSDYIKEIFISDEIVDNDEKIYAVVVRACDLGVLRAQPQIGYTPYWVKENPNKYKKYNPYEQIEMEELYWLGEFKTPQDARTYLDDLLKKLNESR